MMGSDLFTNSAFVISNCTDMTQVKIQVIPKNGD